MRYNTVADHPLMAGSPIETSFKSAPLGFIDVGARRDAPPIAAPIAHLSAFLGFEPDSVECERMNADNEFKGHWATCNTLPIALGKEHASATLYLMSLATNTSLYPPNDIFVERYRPKGMQVLSTEQVTTKTLDEVLFATADSFAGEFIKLDTQGSELDILQGARRLLTERTLAVVAEVEFCEPYLGQPRFSDIEQFLRELGFAFYGFHTTHFRSQKRLNKAAEAGRERLHWADAVFFRDPFDRGGDAAMLQGRKGDALFLIATALQYYDFALEVADADIIPANKRRKAGLVKDLARIDPDRTCDDVRALARKVEEQTARANLIVGKFVDDRRHMNDVQNILDINL